MESYSSRRRRRLAISANMPSAMTAGTGSSRTARPGDLGLMRRAMGNVARERLKLVEDIAGEITRLWAASWTRGVA